MFAARLQAKIDREIHEKNLINRDIPKIEELVKPMTALTHVEIESKKEPIKINEIEPEQIINKIISKKPPMNSVRKMLKKYVDYLVETNNEF